MARPRVLLTPSFERGRLSLRREYCRALADAGLTAWPVPMDAAESPWDYLDMAHGIVLSGGGDIDPTRYGQQPHAALGEVDPERDALEFALIAEALRRQLPVLAVCRGMQVLNVALGGTLIQDIPNQRPMALRHQQKAPRWYLSHAIEVAGGSYLREIYPAGYGRVNSFHHQAVDRVGRDLRPVAAAPDGIIEALEGIGAGFVLAVQWHPEDLCHSEAESRGLFHLFAEACRGVMEKRGETAGGGG
ncbi:gamma-glutamyl-gamma-aminobutyrate hydrolase family protein [Heliobacterium gestii]|uniref:Gamma-glutamyl-gamma-aminobutyrate hydrolase family protein n=1 Tax=Heliomicrobium gestii TaxID=2699 RepID=A0A845LD48_HELGE|nr:gamma-glutamyl-gamma-aminobutyrate hydrolase family protein [Heliomicrobium gestii]MBM7866124.1 putative glutamine amidotransferase [Heliomicrobium gestii]MZP42549.1 gamma-glutamyl-gamma-aminobutyrate hydrolase family protein [Heliomicrobium gestii]